MLAFRFCYEYLKPKRKPRSIDDIVCHLIIKAYLTFTEDELLDLIKKDKRFNIIHDRNFEEISVVRKYNKR